MRRFVTRGMLAAFASLAASCGTGSSGGGAPPLVVAMVVSLAAVDGPTASQATVAVVDPKFGSPISTATVTVNGMRLPYLAAAEAYEAVVDVAPGARVALAVSLDGRTYAAEASLADVFPRITAPAPGQTWAAGCANTVTWTPGAPETGASYLLLLLDASSPTGQVLLSTTFPAPSSTFDLPFDSVSPGARIVAVGLQPPAVPVSTAAAGSQLMLVAGSVAPVTFADTSYYRINVLPQNPGLAPGQAQQLQAVGMSCRGETGELTGLADWNSSTPSVATVSNTIGSQGLLTAVQPGTSTVTATYQGMSGEAAVGVRTFTRRDGGVTASMLLDVTSTGTGLVAVGEGGTILVSGDARSWSPSPSGVASMLDGVAGGAGAVVVTQYASSSVLRSTDGVTWTPVATPASAIYGVAWAGSRFVAVGPEGLVLTSPDGLAWTARNAGTTGPLWSVAWSGSLLVAVGVSSDPTKDFVATSPDGVQWTPQALPAGPAADLRVVAYGGGQFVAAGNGVELTSPDGFTWTRRPGPASPTALAGSDAGFAALDGLAGVYTSTDGVTWIHYQFPDELFRGVTLVGPEIVVVGRDGHVFTSP